MQLYKFTCIIVFLSFTTVSNSILNSDFFTFLHIQLKFLENHLGLHLKKSIKIFPQEKKAVWDE